MSTPLSLRQAQQGRNCWERERRERSLSPSRSRCSSVDSATVAAELRQLRLQGLDRLPSAQSLLSLGSASCHQERRPDSRIRSDCYLPHPLESRHYTRSTSRTTPSRNEETRQELPPISELFDSVDSTYARTRQDHHHSSFPERRPARVQPEYPSGNYTTQASQYPSSSAYQPRPYGRSTLRADYEPRIAAAEQWDTPRAVSSASSVDGHSIPGHGHHPPAFARPEVHPQPHAGHVPHVMAPYNHPYQQHYAYEHQYGHPPNVIYHPETGQYYQAPAWHSLDVVGSVDQYGGRKRRGNLPKDATNQLKRWFAMHGDSPYPSEEEKQHLAQQTGLGMNQISNWFINARRRQPGRDAKEALQREQEARQALEEQRQAQQHSYGSSQPSSTPSPTDESSSSVASIEQDQRRHQSHGSRYEHVRSSPPRTRSGGVAQPYASPSARHAHHRSARRSSTPETRRERRTR
ncbi:hypothetical protein HDK90DRAFT_535652 [Phyllosticta capitalensis]|uniref:Homeobox domain-containing protein n=1 Tax=Phyllosticta capitalensis TaxID=121624 RepID=A0ABR1YIQ6_9PEZI